MRRRSPGWQVFLLLLLCYPSWPKPNLPLFVDITKDAGLDFSHHSGRFGKKFLPETMGSGCAFFDYNNDNWADLFLVNSKDWPNHRSRSQLCRLYRNNRDGTFTDVSREAGLELELYGMGVAVGDYDSDGWNDIYVSGLGGGRLFHNEAGKFRDVTEKADLLAKVLGQALPGPTLTGTGGWICFFATMPSGRSKRTKLARMTRFIRAIAVPPITLPDTPQLFRNLGKRGFC